MPSSGMWRRVGIFLTDSYLFTLVHRSWIASTLKMEAIRSSEMSVKIPTGRHIPEDGILQILNTFFFSVSCSGLDSMKHALNYDFSNMKLMMQEHK
jgi:hypothetical protein